MGYMTAAISMKVKKNFEGSHSRSPGDILYYPREGLKITVDLEYIKKLKTV